MAGCASEQILPQKRFTWPLPPNQPRIEWLASYSSQLDLPKTDFRRFKELITGEDQPLSLAKPVDARLSPDGNIIFVADIERQAVIIFDTARSEQYVINITSRQEKNSFLPLALHVTKNGELYVLDPRLKELLVFSGDNYTFISAIKLPKEIARPASFTLDSTGKKLYVSDSDTNTIFVIDRATVTVEKKIGGPGDTPGTFNRPISICLNSLGELIVADSFNARIQVFSPDGTYLRSFGSRGDGISEFQLIKSVATDPDNNIYVVDSRAHSIKIFNPNGEPLFTLGTFYDIASRGKLSPGGFALPMNIDINSTGVIAVTDQLNRYVHIFKYLRP